LLLLVASELPKLGGSRYSEEEIYPRKVVAGKSASGLGGLTVSGMVAGWARRRF